MSWPSILSTFHGREPMFGCPRKVSLSVHFFRLHEHPFSSTVPGQMDFARPVDPVTVTPCYVAMPS